MPTLIPAKLIDKCKLFGTLPEARDWLATQTNPGAYLYLAAEPCAVQVQTTVAFGDAAAPTPAKKPAAARKARTVKAPSAALTDGIAGLLGDGSERNEDTILPEFASSGRRAVKAALDAMVHAGTLTTQRRRPGGTFYRLHMPAARADNAPGVEA